MSFLNDDTPNKMNNLDNDVNNYPPGSSDNVNNCNTMSDVNSMFKRAGSDMDDFSDNESGAARPDEITAAPDTSFISVDGNECTDTAFSDKMNVPVSSDNINNEYNMNPGSASNWYGSNAWTSIGADKEYRSDSYYMNGEPSYSPSSTFYTTNISSADKKKKKYITVKSAVLAMILTAVISIFGGAILSEYADFVSDKIVYHNSQRISGKGSLQDNINNSAYAGGSNADVKKINGEALTTPEIVDKVGPAVVGIINKTTYGDAYGIYGKFYGNLDEEIEQSSGSGVVISADGYIVTNNHVIENATAISVIMNTGEEYQAKIVGRDPSTDLAVVKIEATGLTFAQMGASSSLRVGDTAIAIGNPLGQEFAGTTTQGIISGLNRLVKIDDKTLNLIQTDAAINPGNSGGALVDIYGNLIGINTAKISSDTLEGLGFAIPIDEAKPIIQDLTENGYVTGRPVIGISGRAVTEEDAEANNLKVGVYVIDVIESGPADTAGVRERDVIVECDGEPIETVEDINKIKNKKSPGDEITLKVYRKSKYIDIKLILGEETPTEY